MSDQPKQVFDRTQGPTEVRAAVLQEILTSLEKLVPYDAAAIVVIDRKSQLLVSEVHRGYDPGREERFEVLVTLCSPASCRWLRLGTRTAGSLSS